MKAQHFPLKPHIFLLNRDMLFLHRHELLCQDGRSMSENSNPQPEFQDKPTSFIVPGISTWRTEFVIGSESLLFQFLPFGDEILVALTTQRFHQGFTLLW